MESNEVFFSLSHVKVLEVWGRLTGNRRKLTFVDSRGVAAAAAAVVVEGGREGKGGVKGGGWAVSRPPNPFRTPLLD